jgi:hypothetical protein
MSGAEAGGAVLPTAAIPRRPAVATYDEAVAAAGAYGQAIGGGAADRDRAGVAPRAELAALDATGVLGITVPAVREDPDSGSASGCSTTCSPATGSPTRSRSAAPSTRRISRRG